MKPLLVPSERAKRASCSITRGHHTGATTRHIRIARFCDKQASRRVATHCLCRSERTGIIFVANSLHQQQVQCPNFILILCFILEDKFGFRVRKVDWTLLMVEWTEQDCKRVGNSLAAFIRKRKMGEHAVDAWRRNYGQLEILFTEVPGFEGE